MFYKKYREIRSRLKRMVIEVLFDPAALKLYFTRRGKNLREIFELGVCVCVCVCVWGLVVKWFGSWAHDPWVMGSSPTTRR